MSALQKKRPPVALLVISAVAFLISIPCGAIFGIIHGSYILAIAIMGIPAATLGYLVNRRDGRSGARGALISVMAVLVLVFATSSYFNKGKGSWVYNELATSDDGNVFTDDTQYSAIWKEDAPDAKASIAVICEHRKLDIGFAFKKPMGNPETPDGEVRLTYQFDNSEPKDVWWFATSKKSGFGFVIGSEASKLDFARLMTNKKFSSLTIQAIHFLVEQHSFVFPLEGASSKIRRVIDECGLLD